MSEKITKLCPSCASPIEFKEKDKTAMCFVCGNKFNVAKLLSNSDSAQGHGGAQVPVTGFDNPESGIVFLENFFDNYDWAEYQDADEIALYDIADVLQKNKSRNGADPKTWYLDFKALCIPVNKKLEGLTTKAEEMGEKYDSEDATESLSVFDIYRKVNNALVAQRDAILKQLDTAIAYAEKFALDEDMLAEMRKEQANLRTKLQSLYEVQEISEVGAYIRAQEKASEEKAAEFARQGIDAKDIYENAVSMHERNLPNKSEILRLFESVRGYRDSIQYIKKINKYYGYFNEMYYFGDKYYIFKKEDFIVPALDVSKLGTKKKGDDNTQEATIQALSLYEVVDGICAEKPILKGVEKILEYYNGKLYYFKKNQGIFYFDLNLKIETCVDKGTSDEYMNDGQYEVQVVLGGTALAVKKKLRLIEAKGCRKVLKSLKLVKKKEEEKLVNNYQLLLVNLLTGEGRVLIPEMVDIAIPYDKEMFYVYAERVALSKKKKAVPGAEEELDYKTTLMVCDLVTGQSRSILGEDCDIHTVVDKKVVYSLWKPNKYNKDLHVYDMETEEDILIEDNIWDFKAMIKDRIYYTVGNIEFKPLISTKIDGTDRKEIMKYAKEILMVRGNWLYVHIYWEDVISALMKISADGEKRIVLCTDFKRLVSFRSTKILYVDTDNCMHVVRSDGEEDKILAEDVGSFFVTGDDCIYYERKERVSADDKALSLYKMDLDGNNAKKLVFNVKSISNYDETRLYYKKEEDIRYKLTIPNGKKEPEERFETYTVSRYFAYDKASGTSELVLTVGLPHEKNTFSTGCLRKKVDADVIYEEQPAKCEFKYRGLAKVGQVEEEREADKENKSGAIRNLLNKDDNTGDGDGSTGCGGCASIFKKKK